MTEEGELNAAISRVMEHVTLKFGEMIRCLASLGGHRDFACIEILKELAQTEDGFLSFTQLQDKRPDLASGAQRFIEESYMQKIHNRVPDSVNHLLFDETVPALIIDDP